jgi:hypothetical protein
MYELTGTTEVIKNIKGAVLATIGEVIIRLIDQASTADHQVAIELIEVEKLISRTLEGEDIPITIQDYSYSAFKQLLDESQMIVPVKAVISSALIKEISDVA